MSPSTPSQWLKSPYLWLGATVIAAFFAFRGGDFAKRPRVKAPSISARPLTDRDSRREPGATRPKTAVEAPGGRREGLAYQSPSDVESGAVTVGTGPREIRGWVKDIIGAAVMGTAVRLSTVMAPEEELAEGVDTVSGTWSLMTHADGGFVFAGAPVGQLRLTATGPDGSLASAVVPWSEGGTTEVILTLEATGTIIVRVDDPRLRDARVIIRTSDFRAHGAGAPPPPTDAELEAMALAESEASVIVDSVDAGENTDYGAQPENEGEVAVSEDQTEPAESEEAMLAQVAEAVQGPLLQWDADDVEGSMARLFEGVFSDMPELRAMLVMQLENEQGEAVDKDPAALARSMAQLTLKQEPMMGLALGFVSERFKTDPERGLLALMEDPDFEQEMETFVEEQEALQPRAAVDDEMPAEESVLSPPSDELQSMETAEPWVDPVDAERAALESEWGPLAKLLTAVGSPHEEDASGRLGEPITVRTGFEYHVFIAIDAEHHELKCGSVTVGAGETVEWVCGREQDAALVGVVVDIDGRPVAGAKLELRAVEMGDTLAEVVSDASGRFQLHASSASALAVKVVATLEIDPEAPGNLLHGQLGRVSLMPGRVQDVGRLVMATPTQHSELETQVSGTGIVTQTFVDMGDGIAIGDIDSTHPLATLGAESTDLLLRVGDQEASRMSYASAMLLLQHRGAYAGDAPTAGQELVLRRTSGEVYSLAMPSLN